MNSLFHIFSTREYATGFYIVIIAIYALSNKNVRPSTITLIKTALNKKIVGPFLVFIVYAAIITFLFTRSSFWNNLYLKDIITWTLFAGVPICYNAIGKDPKSGYFKEIVINNIKATALVEYLFGSFTFNIFVEFILQPVILFISIIQIYADKSDNSVSVRKLCDAILSIIGITIFILTIRAAISDYKYLNIQITAVSFLIPLVYSVLFLPVSYLFALIAKYEIVFIRMGFYDDNSPFKSKHRKQLLQTCRLSLKRLILFEREYLHQMYAGMSEASFDEIMKNLKASM